MEHTERYYELIAQVIHGRGLTVNAVNPLLIREYGGNSLRRVKTDKADVKKIALEGKLIMRTIHELTRTVTTGMEMVGYTQCTI